MVEKYNVEVIALALRTLLQFRALDLTASINDRYTRLISPGVIDGGLIVPVAAQLKIDLGPFKLVSLDGMVVEETSAIARLACAAGQTTVIACRAIYVQNNDPDVEVVAIELSTFNALINKANHVVFGHVVVPLAATSILTSYIDTAPRDIVDKIGRDTFRGVLSNPSLLPGANNRVGDYYMVVDGVGGPTHLYGWTGFQWIIMTDAVTVTNDLAAHRQNLFTDEKHLTDNEKLAVVGTSGTAVSGSNKLIDNADTRIPTQGENDALVGSDGTPSSSNLYITEGYPLAAPAEKVTATAPATYFELTTVDGPVFVGKDGVGTANKYFQFFDPTLDREYLTAASRVVLNVSGVYTDALLLTLLNPSLSPSVDSDGFYSGSSLYVKFDTAPDTALRLLYGKREILKSIPIDILMRRTVNDGQTSGDVIKTVELIKGRSWDTTPPVNEQNIELRKDIVDLKQYVSSAFRADYVVGGFNKVSGVPDFNGDFVDNVGVNQNYSFQNSSLVGVSYVASTGVVTYASVVSLVSVVANQHVFIDSNLVEYRVTAVGVNSVTIANRNGSTPPSIGTAVTLAAHGSIKPDNNPRRVNLATMEFLSGRDRVYVREIESSPNDFHPVSENLGYQIRSPIRSPFFREPRVRFYGGFKNRDAGPRARVVATATGRALVTGFFNDLRMLVDLQSASPIIVVKVNGDPVGTVIDLSLAGTVAGLGADQDFQAQSVSLVSGLNDQVPNSVDIEITDAVGDFLVYGFDLFRYSPTTVYNTSGRVFAQSDLLKSDTFVASTAPVASTRARGVVYTKYVNRSLLLTNNTYNLTDLDGAAGGPAGTAVPASFTFTVTSGLTKFGQYKVGDVVKLVTATGEEVRYISGISPTIATFSTAVTVSGSAILLHMASTAATAQDFDPLRETARYNITDLGAKQTVDFAYVLSTPSDRLFTVEDGTTSLVGKDVAYVTTGIDGADIALNFTSPSASLRIRALASRCDAIFVNNSAIAASVTLDGSDTYVITVPGGGTSRVPLWRNARYQSHEAFITNASGVTLSSIILFEPAPSTKLEGALTATQNVLARYNTSVSTAGSIIPLGAAAIDPFVSGGVYVNGPGVGTAWSYVFSLTQNPAWGRYVSTSLEGAYFEYYFMGDGFEIEYLAKNDLGRPAVFLSGTIANNTNFPSAVFFGMTAATGEIDMYDVSAAPVRKRFGISNLPYGRYTLRVQVQQPRQKNAASSGFEINISTFYEVNSSGLLSITPSRGFRDGDFAFGLEYARDDRNFDNGAIAKEEVPVVRTVVQQARSQRVNLISATTSIAVVFPTAFDDTDYAVTCTMLNIVDTSPEFQPITVTSFSTTGFTATWNDPLDSSNYQLCYTAIKFA